MNYSYYNGFVKAAQVEGYSEDEACTVFKKAFNTLGYLGRLTGPILAGEAAGAYGASAGGIDPMAGMIGGGLAGLGVGVPWSHHYVQAGTRKQKKSLEHKKNLTQQDKANLTYLKSPK